LLIVSSALLFNAILCAGFLWNRRVPSVQAIQEPAGHYGDVIEKVYESSENMLTKSTLKGSRYKLHNHNQGMNCGGYDTPIFVNSLNFPDTIELGGTASVSVDLSVKKTITKASLVKVELTKDGSQVPCIEEMGSCSYNNPCKLLENIPQCPPQVLQSGWNCKCPLPERHVKLSNITIQVPTVPLPAFLIDGRYSAEVQMFDGSVQLFCYKVDFTLEKK